MTVLNKFNGQLQTERAKINGQWAANENNHAAPMYGAASLGGDTNSVGVPLPGMTEAGPDSGKQERKVTEDLCWKLDSKSETTTRIRKVFSERRKRESDCCGFQLGHVPYYDVSLGSNS